MIPFIFFLSFVGVCLGLIACCEIGKLRRERCEMLRGLQGPPGLMGPKGDTGPAGRDGKCLCQEGNGWDEGRMDIIGQNGNEGLHYEEAER